MADKPTVGEDIRRLITVKRVAAAVLVVIAVVFIVQNGQSAEIALFALTLTAPLWLALGAMAVLGAAVGWLLSRRH